MEKLSNKGLVTIILGALMMGSVVVIISSISMKFKVTLRRYKWKKLQL